MGDPQCPNCFVRLFLVHHDHGRPDSHVHVRGR